MPAGIPAKPTRLKELAGNPGKRPLNKSEPAPSGKLTAPKTLSPAALAIWKRAVAGMPPGVFTSVDENVLAAFCEACANHQAATKALRTEPLVVTGSTGQLVMSPWLKSYMFYGSEPRSHSGIIRHAAPQGPEWSSLLTPPPHHWFYTQND